MPGPTAAPPICQDTRIHVIYLQATVCRPVGRRVRIILANQAGRQFELRRRRPPSRLNLLEADDPSDTRPAIDSVPTFKTRPGAVPPRAVGSAGGMLAEAAEKIKRQNKIPPTTPATDPGWRRQKTVVNDPTPC